MCFLIYIGCCVVAILGAVYIANILDDPNISDDNIDVLNTLQGGLGALSVRIFVNP